MLVLQYAALCACSAQMAVTAGYMLGMLRLALPCDVWGPHGRFGAERQASLCTFCSCRLLRGYAAFDCLGPSGLF